MGMNRSLMVPCAAVALLLCVLASSSAIANDRFEPIREHIREQLQERLLPSIAVAVAKDGRIVWEEGFGWADLERRVPADAHTPYSLASISKPITTTGLMTLVRDSKVDLDRPVNDYLGAVKLVARVGDASQATVRRVANHTAGLPLHYQFFYEDEPYRRPSMDETLLRYGNLVSAPGEHYQYSNLGYGVLDYIIERVSGQSYAEFMRREVFLPLGMTRTSVDMGPGLEAYAATRYDRDNRPIPFYGFDHPGGSAVFSSAHDLVRFGMFHLKSHLPDQKPILPDAMIDEMHRATGGLEGDRYGIGFGIDDRHGYRVVSHTGSMAGVSTVMWLLPEQGIAIVVLGNASSGLPADTANRIAATLLSGWKIESRNARGDERPDFVTPVELAGTWTGILHTYAKDLPVALEFRPDGQVHATLDSQMVALVDGADFNEGRFGGRFAGRVGTPDTDRYRNLIQLDLKLRGHRLNGAATTVGPNPAHDDSRMRNALSHWIELERK